MERSEIFDKVKQIIGSIAGIDPQRIADDVHLRDDLKLDSLSLLEIGVDIDLSFQLDLPDEAYRGIEDVPSMVALIVARQAEVAAASGPSKALAG